MATRYLRTGAGACGPGDQELLDTAAGSAATVKGLDAIGDTWTVAGLQNQTIPAGNWTFILDHDVPSGPGPNPDVRIQVQVRNSSCGVKQTIIDETVGVTKGTSQGTVSTAPVNPGAVNIAENDRITVTLTQTGGVQVVDVRYNGAALGTSDSRLTHPDGTIHIRGYVASAEMEAPDVAVNGQAEVSFAELETPDVSGKSQVSFAELETPDVSGQAEVSFTELEVPNPEGRSQVSFAELEVPDAGIAGRAQISFAEYENDPKILGKVFLSSGSLEAPNVPGSDSVTFVKPKSFNSLLLEEELEAVGLKPAQFNFSGFETGTDGITFNPQAFPGVQIGLLILSYNVVLTADDRVTIEAILDAHVFTDTTGGQQTGDQDDRDLQRLREAWLSFALLTDEQKDSILRAAIRLIVTLHRGDADLLDASIQVDAAELEVPRPVCDVSWAEFEVPDP